MSSSVGDKLVEINSLIDCTTFRTIFESVSLDKKGSEGRHDADAIF
jgi:hypothetical protein